MKFQFKVQPFQTQAAEAVVRVFAGRNAHGARVNFEQIFKTYSPTTQRKAL